MCRSNLIQTEKYQFQPIWAWFVHIYREDNMYGLLTKCEVKMAEYWPRSFFACLWTETKKERGQYPAILTEQTWSIKDLLYGFW